MKFTATMMIVFGLLAGCGNSKLTEPEARRLVEALPDYRDGVRCALSLSGTRRDNFEAIASASPGEYRVQIQGCGPALVEAGMGTLGPEHPVYGVPRIQFPASAREENNKVLIPCASVQVLSVSGIATTGNTAVFKYEYEIKLNDRVAWAGQSCLFHPPAAGRLTKERNARRDDDGRWSLVE